MCDFITMYRFWNLVLNITETWKIRLVVVTTFVVDNFWIFLYKIYIFFFLVFIRFQLVPWIDSRIVVFANSKPCYGFKIPVRRRVGGGKCRCPRTMIITIGRCNFVSRYKTNDWNCIGCSVFIRNWGFLNFYQPCIMHKINGDT